MKKLLSVVLLSVLLAGCASRVPPTVIKVPGKLTLISPKQVVVTNFVAEILTNGTVRVSIGSVSSKNDPDVVGSVAAANAAMAQSSADLLKAVVGSPAVQGALKAAGAAAGVP